MIARRPADTYVDSVPAMVRFLTLVSHCGADDAVEGYAEDDREAMHMREVAEANGWIGSEGRLTPSGDSALLMEPRR